MTEDNINVRVPPRIHFRPKNEKIYEFLRYEIGFSDRKIDEFLNKIIKKYMEDCGVPHETKLL